MAEEPIAPAASETPAAPAAATPAPAATIAGGGDTPAPAASETPAAAPAAAEASWRDKFAGDDKTFRGQLERYATEADFGKAHRALHQKLSSGEYKRDLAADATPEQIAEWRKERGIPETWEKYDAPKLPDGLVLSDADKPVVDLFTQFAHAENMRPAERDKVLNWYYQTQDALASERAEQDTTFKTQAEDALRADWGADYRANLNVIGNLLAQFPEDVGAQLLAGRTFDGKKIGDDPRIMKVLAKLGRELDPAATLVNPSGGTPGATVDSRLEEIRKFAREKPDEYDADKKMQAERLNLTEIRDRQRSRGKAA